MAETERVDQAHLRRWGRASPDPVMRWLPLKKNKPGSCRIPTGWSLTSLSRKDGIAGGFGELFDGGRHGLPQ